MAAISTGDLRGLEAEGLIKSGLLANKPITRREAERLLGEVLDSDAIHSMDGKGVLRDIERLRFDLDLENNLRTESYLKLFEQVRLKYVLASESPHYLNFNNMGDTFREGSHLRVDFSARAQLFDKVRFLHKPGVQSSFRWEWQLRN